MSEENKRLECNITGRVQMVMFRDFTRRNAKRLGIFGTVQNKTDGSVSVVAEGEKEKLQKLLSLLHKGSFLSRVDNISERWREYRGEFSDFKIIY